MMEDFKEHPMVASLIQGGKSTEYMAHWLSEGGYDAIPQLCGDGYIIAGDSGMLFNALHREGSNLAMTSGRFAAEAMLEALEKGDFSRSSLQGYISRLQNSYIFKDLKKYRRFGHFLETHSELFTSLPEWTSQAAREILTVNGIPKKEKQKILWNQLRAKIPLMRLLRIFWNGWKSVR
jgi:electron transfer flavoprotein-quinone oxidoreductase